MKLFLVLHPKAPRTFFKAENEDGAREQWYHGITYPEKYPTVEVIEIRDIPHLMEYLPNEFKITDDASF